MGAFGWSYPPGCSGPPDDDREEICEVCTLEAGSCICPECSCCGEHGNPTCYTEHFLEMTEEQVAAREAGLAAAAVQEQQERERNEDLARLFAEEDAYLDTLNE